MTTTTTKMMSYYYYYYHYYYIIDFCFYYVISFSSLDDDDDDDDYGENVSLLQKELQQLRQRLISCSVCDCQYEYYLHHVAHPITELVYCNQHLHGVVCFVYLS